MERDIIGLGKNCFVASMLYRLGVLKPRDIFDDVGTQNLGSFAYQIETNFETFFVSVDNLDFYAKSADGIRWFVRDKGSDMLAVKHFFVDHEKEVAFQNFKKDHDPNLFMYRLKHSKSPLLLRTNDSNTTLEEVMYFREVVEKVRGNDDFVFCVFQDALWADRDWEDIPSLKTFRLKGLFSAPAERYPDKTPSDMEDRITHIWNPNIVSDRVALWSDIMNYIFEEVGLSIKTKYPKLLSIKVL